MPIEEKRIYRIIEDTPSNLSPKQIAIQASDDSDLGFKMLYWRDANSLINYALAKDQPGWLESLKCSEELWLGDNKETVLGWDTTQTPAALMLGLGSVSNSMMICREADVGTDYALGLYTDPTLVMKAAGTTVAERTEISHGLINVASGDIQVNANNFIYDYNPDSHTFIGVPTANFITGEGHTVNSQYTHHSAIFGRGNSVNGGYSIDGGYQNTDNGSFNVLGGYNNTNNGSECGVFGTDNTLGVYNDNCVVGGENVTLSGSPGGHNLVVGEDINCNGHHNVVSGDTQVVNGDYCSVFGQENNIASDSNWVIAGGSYNDLDGADCAIVGGTSNDVNAGYGLTIGTSNENNHDSAIVHGAFAITEWNMGRFFSTARLDGATNGISQCFDSTMLCRHTTATDQVVLTRDGSGSTSPLVINAETAYRFTVSILSAEETNTGLEYHEFSVYAYRGATGGIGCYELQVRNNQTNGPVITVQFYENNTDHTVEIKVTPQSTNPTNIVAHIYAGIKIKSGWVYT